MDNLQELFSSALDNIRGQVAILDSKGTVIYANRAWREFARLNPAIQPMAVCVGENYLDACEHAEASTWQGARSFAGSVRAVIAGDVTDSIDVEFLCRIQTAPHWFSARVSSAIVATTIYAAITHFDITARKATEKRIAQNELLLRSFYDSSPMIMGIVELRADSLIHISCNSAAAKLFGLKQERADEQDQLLPTGVVTLWTAHCRESAGTGLPARFIWQHTAQGEPRWFSVTVSPMPYEDGGQVCFSYIAEDITEQRQVNEALHQSEARLEEAQQIARLGSWELDIATQRITWSKELFRLLDHDPEQGIPAGQELAGMFASEDIDKLNRLIRQAVKTGMGYNVELRRKLPNGATRWYQMAGNTVKDASGNVTGLFGTLLDITERWQMEEALRMSEARLEEAQRIARMGSWERNLDTGERYWSRGLYDLFGLEPQHGPPPFERLFALFHPDDAERLRQLMRQDFAADLRRILPDGTTGWLHVIGHQMEELNGSRIRAGIMLDVTGRKQAEQEMARLHASLREAHEQETVIAARVQSMLLASEPPRDLRGVTIAALSLPSQQVDGDFSDFIVHSNAHFDVVVGDVMGKGIGAALLGAAAKSRLMRCFMRLLSGSAERGLPSLQAVVNQLHAEMTPQLIQLDTFITATFARFDLENRRAYLVDCGHTRTIRFQAGSCCLRRLKGEGVPFGFLAEERYKEREVSIGPGDRFVFYSDGITEAQNPEGQMYGERRLIELLRTHHRQEPEQLVAALERSLREFTGVATFTDDVTCIVVAIDACDAPASPC